MASDATAPPAPGSSTTGDQPAAVKYVPTKEERAAKKLVKVTRQRAIGSAVHDIVTATKSASKAVSKEFGIPKKQVDLMIGSRTASNANTRAPTAYNGWLQAEIGRMNESKYLSDSVLRLSC